MKRAVFVVLSLLALVGAGLTALMLTMPDPRRITQCVTAKMHGVSLCEKDKSYARLPQISAYLKDVVVISEDASFYHHNGFDWFEIKNSLRVNWQERSYTRGGSTITQQLAKNVFLSAEKSLSRKLREAYLAFQIEQLLPKQKILEKYLNVVEFGDGLYGVKAAAQYYFGKSPSEINLLEAAYLAYLLPNPKVYSRIFKKGEHTQFSRYRILDLCYKMYRYGRIGEDQYRAAKDYVDLFPWKSLDETQIARLEGRGEEILPAEIIPEQETVPLEHATEEPPVATEEIMQEIEAETAAVPEPADQTFDN